MKVDFGFLLSSKQLFFPKLQNRWSLNLIKMNKKKIIGIFLSGVIFFLASSVEAQPTCSAYFHPFDTCFREIQNKEFVFLGRVVSVENNSLSRAYGKPLKAIVEVETLLKGNPGQRIELFLDTFCFGSVVENGRFIFTAGYVYNEKVSGLFSETWSFAISEEYSEKEVEKILDQIRKVIRGEKLPRLVGKVIQQNWSPEGRFLMRASSLNVKLGYDPNYAQPLKDVTVTAKRKEDGREFKTKTDAEGEYGFEDLPTGKYEVYTDLPKEYDVQINGLIRLNSNEIGFVNVDDGICGRKVEFNVQLQGDIQIRFDNALSSWSHIILSLWRVGEDDGKRKLNEFAYDAAKDKFLATEGSGDIGYRHSFKKVPVGKYILRLNVTIDPKRANKTVYYPGTFEVEKAAVIDVEAGETLNLVFSLPDIR
ncbi:MAG: carboxypeptidase-like regulatory domain-containing protein [Pyrinomonadaceae bacterium]